MAAEYYEIVEAEQYSQSQDALAFLPYRELEHPEMCLGYFVKMLLDPQAVAIAYLVDTA